MEFLRTGMAKVTPCKFKFIEPFYITKGKQKDIWIEIIGGLKND